MTEKDEISAEIIYHFDVDHHRIPLAQFIDTAAATRDILDNFNRQFFDGMLKYDLDIAPSEEGGHITNIVLTIAALATIPASTVTFLESETWGYISKKITGESSTDYKSDEGTHPDTMDETSKKLLVNCIAGMPIYFLSEDIDKLANNNITPDNFRKAFKARNTFYTECIKNRKIQGIAFDRSHDFPIKRDTFQSKIINLPDEPIETQEYKDTITTLIVNSPNWNRHGRGWEATKDGEKRPIQFTIEDNEFWKRVDDKEIPTTIKDDMRVQLIYQDKGKGRTNVRVIKVLYYNDERISYQLSPEKIQERCNRENIILENEEDDKHNDDQDDLFSKKSPQ